MPHVALPGFSFSQAINLLRSFAGSVFRATIHSGVRHWFEKLLYGAAQKDHALSQNR
jgi:hypothetical protein